MLRLFVVGDVYSPKSIDKRGGLAELASMLQLERQRAKEQGFECLFLCAGDVLGGHSHCEEFKGANSVAYFNELGTDLHCCSNHCFDFGPEVLEERISEANFPWLGDNVRWRGDERCRLKGMSSMAMMRLNNSNVNVGFFGVCTADTPRLSWPTDRVCFENVVESAERCYRTLVSNDLLQANVAADAESIYNIKHSWDGKTAANIVIAMTHTNFNEDKAIARRLHQLDSNCKCVVIIGGHDHHLIQQEASGIIIVKSGMNARYLGIVDVDTRIGDVIRYEVKQNYGYEPLASMTMLIEKYTLEYDKRQESVFGDRNRLLVSSLPTPLDATTATCRSRPSNFGELVADAMYTIANDALRPFGKSVDLAIINGGFIRSDRCYQNGATFSTGDLLEALPFPKHVVVVEIKRKDLILALNSMMKSMPAPAGSFPHLSRSALVRATVQQEEGGVQLTHFVTSSNRNLLINDDDGDDDNCLYLIAITYFMALGGDNNEHFTKSRLLWPLDASQVQQIARVVLNFFAHKDFDINQYKIEKERRLEIVY